MTRLARNFSLPLLLAAMLVAVWITPAGAATLDCSDHRAWSKGPHLGHQNAEIQALYLATWGNRACQEWAKGHRTSAILGLRRDNYLVERRPDPVLQVDSLTFRGTGAATGTVRLEAGQCYAVWIDEPRWTPEDQIAGWSRRYGEGRYRPGDGWFQVWFRPSWAQSGDVNQRGWAGAADHVTIEIVDRAGRYWESFGDTFGRRADYATSAGELKWEVRVPYDRPEDKWEMRFVPTDYVQVPWASSWPEIREGSLQYPPRCPPES